jgi:hypothetical protein
VLLVLLLSLLLLCSGFKLQPPAFEGSSGFTVESSTLFGVLNEARVHKTQQEVALLQYVSDVGSRAHIAMMQVRNQEEGGVTVLWGGVGGSAHKVEQAMTLLQCGVKGTHRHHAGVQVGCEGGRGGGACGG